MNILYHVAIAYKIARASCSHGYPSAPKGKTLKTWFGLFKINPALS